MDTQESFGQLVRRYRRDAELTQEVLAERAGISVRAVRGIEAGSQHRPRQYTVRRLADALALSPAEQQALLEAVCQARVPASHGGPDDGIVSGTSLLVPLSSFIGREHEVATVAGLLLDPAVRLLTLTGPGGIGKTRLALQVATSLQDRFADGVLVVPLASLADPAFVLSAVAQVLGMQEQGERPLLERLSAALQDRHLLLLLDNLEHLLPASRLIAQLLAAAPSVHLLITSRIALHVTGEQEYAVPPLALPDPQYRHSLESVGQSEAVRLFVARARAVKADVRLTEENAPAIAEICRRLDGLPLAIELAAARSKLFPPGTLLARLSPSLPLLTGGPRDLPARLQTVRGAIDWSYGLLGPDEQRLFARLAVFAGGSTIEAVERVCDLEGDADLLGLLSGLVDQSLVQRVGEEEPRAVLLETIREYAEGRLAERGEWHELRERHARFYLALAEEAAHAVARPVAQPDQPEWLERLEREHDNLRAVLRWAHDSGQPELGLRLAIALSPFWQIRGYAVEGHGWLTQLLALGGNDVSPWMRASATFTRGELLFAQGRAQEATQAIEQSFALFQDLGDLEGSMKALDRLTNFFLDPGNHARRTIELLTKQVTVCRERGERRLLARSLCLLASPMMWHGRGGSQARVLGEESLALFRELGDVQGTLSALAIVAAAAYKQGDLVHARAWTDELLALLPSSSPEVQTWDDNSALVWAARDRGDYARATRLQETIADRARALGDTQGATMARLCLSTLALEQGGYDRALTIAQECLTVFQKDRDPLRTGWALLALSGVARDQGDPAPAIELAGQALAVFRASGSQVMAGIALISLGHATRHRGDYARAEALLAESLSLFPEGSGLSAEVLAGMGLVALEQQQYERAHQVLIESLQTQRTFLVGTVVEGLASAAIGQGEAERAARLFGAADMIRHTMGTPRWPADEALYQRHVSLTREALGEDRLARIWDEGRAMTTEEAIVYAPTLAAGESRADQAAAELT